MENIEEEKIRNLQQYYFDAIKLLQDEEDIRKELPSIEYKSFYVLINGLMKIIDNEMTAIEELMSEADEEELAELKRDLDLWKIKYKLCSDLMDEADKNVDDEQTIDNNKPKTLIFASTSGGTCFERDLKSVPEEKYDEVIDCLDKLREGVIDGDEKKEKRFKNNACLQGLHEKKAFQVRIVYRVLAPDMLYVMMVRIKKNDNDSVDVDGPVLRKKTTLPEYETLKKQIQGIDKKNAIIVANQEIYGRIVALLDKKKRGQKHGQ